ncbi:Uncharacterised protein [Candidatus Venteria ishoeyi]|uniref:Uncharacterized protein n=1 Tax=Candidatus Venteria ishoeyi TaxID=1899563 RepID=A0A1H6F4W2_9GAMM|nr:Uncharacterised protein [Candidatus Venteria ishoeyi]
MELPKAAFAIHAQVVTLIPSSCVPRQLVYFPVQDLGDTLRRGQTVFLRMAAMPVLRLFLLTKTDVLMAWVRLAIESLSVPKPFPDALWLLHLVFLQ